MSLCLFGGAFNPPHLTHERVIRAALAQLPVERVVVLPTGRHPLKDAGELAPAEARLELCRLAFGDLEGAVEVDDWELRQSGPSYTVDTLHHFREYAAGGARPYWIIGSDNLKILPSWHRHRELCELAVIVTCPRMGHPVDATSLLDLDLEPRARDEILEHVLQMEPDDVSASQIRACLREHRSASQWLRPAVERRIHELGLYETLPTDS